MSALTMHSILAAMVGSFFFSADNS
jgi:hypothetical protein